MSLVYLNIDLSNILLVLKNYCLKKNCIDIKKWLKY